MFGSLAWITVINDPNNLAPIGAIGELVVEGPAVARGYLNNEELTRASFIDVPPWLQDWRPNNQTGRLYRTGNMVRYGDDGIICFVGRHDTQVKLCGQRVELSEVEYHLHRCFDGAQETVAEVIEPSEGEARAILVAFVFAGQACESRAASCLAIPTESFMETASHALAPIRGRLAVYMIPTVLLPLVTIPLTGTGKINQRELRQVAAGLTRDEINSYVPTSDDTQSSFKRPPGNEIERQLHVICAQLLNIDLNTIGMDDDFFRLGGDSISAMQVAAKAKAVGLAITATDILSRKSIAGMASSSIKSLPW
jgi:aryl carrier-like protein